MTTSNLELIQYAKELGINNFKIFMKDELNGIPESIECGIVNSDKSSGEGIHWVSYYINKQENKYYYFDSFGARIMQQVKDYLQEGNKIQIHAHSFQIQGFNEQSCGFYCILFLYLCQSGMTYEEIVFSFLNDT